MDDYCAILNLLHDYADAIDHKNWDKLASAIFTDDVDMDFVTWQAHSPAEAVAHIRGFLDGCGPTQHLLGSYRVEIEGDEARVRHYVRAFHIGAGKWKGETYEMAGEYIDVLRRTEAGWRIAKRRGLMHYQLGNPAVVEAAG
jgi:ketosteroid isomerase-like protein